jgi:hypothetical protein
MVNPNNTNVQDAIRVLEKKVPPETMSKAMQQASVD